MKTSRIKTCMTVGILFILLISFSFYQIGASEGPKNIIFFIGDGMGVSHITAGKTVKGELNLEKFKVMGLITTHCSNRYVTDSAAGGTALATGFKTNKYYLSMLPSGKPLKTVLEYAEECGKSTGLVVTSRITHATPACFVSHLKSRDYEDIIAEDLLNSDIEVLFGGGLNYFLPGSDARSKRNDDRNLLVELKKKYAVALTRKDFEALGKTSAAFGLFALDSLPPIEQRIVSLAEMTKKALDILSTNSKGFFLMVEGSQIDCAGHNNDSDYLIDEMIDFDEAVGEGVVFASKNPNTLIVVTSDHETGGYALIDGSVKNRKITKTGFASDYHTGTMVPVFALGPMDDIFGGIHDNTYIGKKLIELITD